MRLASTEREIETPAERKRFHPRCRFDILQLQLQLSVLLSSHHSFFFFYFYVAGARASIPEGTRFHPFLSFPKHLRCLQLTSPFYSKSHSHQVHSVLPSIHKPSFSLSLLFSSSSSIFLISFLSFCQNILKENLLYRCIIGYIHMHVFYVRHNN